MDIITNPNQPNSNQNISSSAQESKNQSIPVERPSDEIYTMPRAGGKMSESVFVPENKIEHYKSTGWMVMSGAFILLVILLGVFGYYLYRWNPALFGFETITSTPNTAENNAIVPANTEDIKQEALSGAESQNNNGEKKQYTIDELNAMLNPVEASSSTNENVITSSTEVIPSISPRVTKEEIISSNDTDGDGLINAEEQIIGSDPNNKDTNGNGKSDLDDFLALKDLIGKEEKDLSTNFNFTQYINNTYKYSLIYPVKWSYSVFGQDDTVIFKTEDKQNFQVLAIDNSKKLELDKWYAQEVSDKTIEDDQRINKNGWYGLKNPNNETVYTSHPNSDRIFVISYSNAINSPANYNNLFTLIVNSFKVE